MIALPAHVERRHIALGAAGCLALGVVTVVDPSERMPSLPCPLRTITGLDCPLCGATRATHALARGDLLGALDFNALYVLALPAVLFAVGWWLVWGRVPSALQRPATRWAIVAIAFAFLVARNFTPFTVLAS